MASKDIEKLKEKFEKDPNSKFFLPLAEEYRKEGMLEEAIDVLQKGIEKHATYTSARVLLGKTYLEKGLLDEARREFESVIKIVPDNLFAHKKLAELYRDTGETELAIKAFRTILKLNPMDEESLSNLRDIEAVLSPAPSEGEAGKADSRRGEIRMPGAGESAAYGEISMAEDEVPAAEEQPVGEEIHLEAPDIQIEQSDDELNAFKDSLFGDKADMGDEHDESHVETVEEAEGAGTASLSEDEVAAAEELSFEDVGEAIAQEMKPDVGGPFPGVQEAEELSFEDLGEAIAQETEPAGRGPLSAAPEPEETLDLGEQFEIDEEPLRSALEEPLIVPKKELADLSDADRFVAEGKFAEAMGVYRKFLADDPEDKRVLQRVDELRSLLKLLGKDKEVLVDRLNAFLEGIYKGRDGFLGHS